MGMANLSITVCDSCHKLGEETSAWAIHGPENSRKLDLCAKHSGELEKFLDKLAPGTAKTPRRSSMRTTRKPMREDGFHSRVTTIEELQKAKAAGEK